MLALQSVLPCFTVCYIYFLLCYKIYHYTALLEKLYFMGISINFLLITLLMIDKYTPIMLIAMTAIWKFDVEWIKWLNVSCVVGNRKTLHEGKITRLAVCIKRIILLTSICHLLTIKTGRVFSKRCQNWLIHSVPHSFNNNLWLCSNITYPIVILWSK